MITLALIGIGQWGKNFIYTASSIPNCQIKYICSKTAEKLTLVGGDYIKTTNFRDLFNYPDIDGVIVATTGSTHYEISKEFLKRGFNLLIEKPLTLNYLDALKLKSLKDKTKAKVLVGHVYLFDPAYAATKKLFNKLGEIRYISYEGVNRGPYRKDMSILWDMGPHPISILLDLYQDKPVQIKAWALDSLRPNKKLFDIVFMELKFSNGGKAFVKISWLSPFKRRELIIFGSKDAIIYNDLNLNKVSYYKNIAPRIMGGDAINDDFEEFFPPYNSQTPLEMELGEFVEAIEENREIKKSDLDFGVKVARVLEQAERSLRDKSTINF